MVTSLWYVATLKVQCEVYMLINIPIRNNIMHFNHVMPGHILTQCIT